MSKELRAFRKICKNINNYEFTDEYKKNKKLIETALKDYKELKKLKLLPYPEVNDEEYRRSVIKRLQAFEIIKEKRVDIDWFLQFVDQDISYKTYVCCVEDSDDEFAKRFLLNEEEYDLLKEVLKND